MYKERERERERTPKKRKFLRKEKFSSSHNLDQVVRNCTLSNERISRNIFVFLNAFLISTLNKLSLKKCWCQNKKVTNCIIIIFFSCK